VTNKETYQDTLACMQLPCISCKT